MSATTFNDSVIQPSPLTVLTIRIQELPATEQQKAIEYVEFLTQQVEKRRDEEWFWEMIDLIDFEQETAETALAPVHEALSKLAPIRIHLFHDILAEKLSLLDTPWHYKAASRGMGGSSDAFLYARCSVVADGREFYEEVLSDANKFPEDDSFESVLYIPDEAYALKNAGPYDYSPKTIYETMFNRATWGDKAIRFE